MLHGNCGFLSDVKFEGSNLLILNEVDNVQEAELTENGADIKTVNTNAVIEVCNRLAQFSRFRRIL